jgi:large subunit ribosomal protein L19
MGPGVRARGASGGCAAPILKKVSSFMNVIDILEREQLKESVPEFRPGDTVKVYSKIVEGGKERTQMFEGVVTVRRGGAIGETITVRRVSHGVGVEKSFLLHSPRLEKVEVSKRGIVRRSRLYYLSDKVGKAARIKEKKIIR